MQCAHRKKNGPHQKNAAAIPLVRQTMGMQSLFVVLDSTEPKEVQRLWGDFCAEESARQRQAAIRMLQEDRPDLGVEPGTQAFEDAIEELVWYGGSPVSFDGCSFVVVPKPVGVDDMQQLQAWMLEAHKKWDPALAVVHEGRTVVGGWVSV